MDADNCDDSGSEEDQDEAASVMVGSPENDADTTLMAEQETQSNR